MRGEAPRDEHYSAIDLVDDPALPYFLDVKRLAKPEMLPRRNFCHFFYVIDKLRLLYPVHLRERFDGMFRVLDVHTITS
jgi:hypothetical protein